MATLLEVAQRAGVAPSTVSFVLNDSPRVAPETRELVLEAARTLNYTLRKKGRPRRSDGVRTPRRKNTLAFLIPFSEPHLRTNTTYLSVVHAAEMAANRRGLNLIVRSHSPGNGPAIGPLAAKVDGALFISTDSAAWFTDIAARLPTVRVMGVPEYGSPWDHVTYNNRVIGRMAAEHMISRGHERFAFFSPYAGTPPVPIIPFKGQNADREKGFLDTLQAAGKSVRVNPRGMDFQPYVQPERMAEIFRELLLPEPRPTALFVPADHFILQVYGALFSLGLRPGTDLEVISCNNDQHLIVGLHPRPAEVDLHFPAIAAAGVDQLLARLEDPEMPYSVREFEPTLVPADA